MLDLNKFKKFINEAENFNTYNGLVCTVVEPGYCEAEVELTKWSMNPQGVAHGSLIFTLCDVVTGMAAATTGRSMLTQNASIYFLRPGLGEKLRCVSQVVKDGRTTGLIEAMVYDDKDRLIAKGEFTVYYTGEPIILPGDDVEPGENTWHSSKEP